MNQLTDKSLECPYCGETIDVLIDPTYFEQEYIEDCQVCCRPINVFVSESVDGEITVTVHSEDDGC